MTDPAPAPRPRTRSWWRVVIVDESGELLKVVTDGLPTEAVANRCAERVKLVGEDASSASVCIESNMMGEWGRRRVVSRGNAGNREQGKGDCAP